MKRQSHLSQSADELLKRYEDSQKLSKLSTFASNLTSVLTGIPEDEILRKEVSKQIPKLKERLEERLKFFQAKETWNGNIPNLEREIVKCEEIEENMKRDQNMDDVKDSLKWVYHIKNKYGF
jgi:hypothetical protein